ncbi:MAG TPA: isocitrate lyase/phosphoenolpyruvate mutase family protein, partial [Chloroflexota bacterium]
MTGLARLAQQLRALHHAPEPLVLPNAWDAATARSVVDAGFPAVATTSSGVSAALGYADGEGTPADEMFAAVRRITRVIPEVPVTADIESGYALSPEEVVKRLLDAGAVGCNLEDTDHRAAPGSHTLVDAAAQQQRLRSVKEAARAQG